MRGVITSVTAGVIIAATSLPVFGQKLSPSDLATRMSGTWTLNPELSPMFAQPGRAGRRRGGGVAQVALFQQRGGTTPTYPQGIRANPTNTEPTPSAASDLTPNELAERAAMRQMQQIPPAITIAATVDRISIEDDRGEQSCEIDGKSDKVRAFGVYMDVKCRWDKDRLRQEFALGTSKVVRTWGLDSSGRLVVTTRIESITQNFPEQTVVYDRT